MVRFFRSSLLSAAPQASRTSGVPCSKYLIDICGSRAYAHSALRRKRTIRNVLNSQCRTRYRIMGSARSRRVRNADRCPHEPADTRLTRGLHCNAKRSNPSVIGVRWTLFALRSLATSSCSISFQKVLLLGVCRLDPTASPSRCETTTSSA